MILSLAQLASRATEMAGGRMDWDLSNASFWVNTALQEVAQVAGHYPKEAIAVSSTTSGENRYSLPTDYDYLISAVLYEPSNSTATTSRSTLAWPLIGMDANWADGFSLPNTGVPTHYVLYGNWVELYPSPTSAQSLQMRYMSKHPVLIESTATVALDDRWHLAVLYKSVELLEASRNNVEGEAIARNRYLNYVMTVPTDRQLKQRDRNAMRLRFGGFGRCYPHRWYR
jgi:hypothetical protein